jgi:hypothetical protein
MSTRTGGSPNGISRSSIPDGRPAPLGALSRDGHYLVIGNGWPKRLDLVTGKLDRLFDDYNGGNYLKLSPDDKYIAVCSHSPRKGCELFAGKLRDDQPLQPLTQGVGRLAEGSVLFLDERRCVVSAPVGGKIPVTSAIFDIETGEQVDRWPALGLRLLAASPRGLVVAADRVTQQLTLLDGQTGEKRGAAMRLPMVVSDYPESIAAAIAPSGRYLAVINDDPAILLFDLLLNRELPPLVCAAPKGICFTADGRQLLSWHADGKLLTWDAAKIVEPLALAPREEAFDAARMFAELTSDNALECFLARERLPAHRAELLAFLEPQLQQVGTRGGDDLNRLVLRLTSDDLNVRKAALADIGTRGELVAAAVMAYQKQLEAQGVQNDFTRAMRDSIIRERFLNRLQGKEQGERGATTFTVETDAQKKLRAQHARLLRLLPVIGGDEARAVLESIAAPKTGRERGAAAGSGSDSRTASDAKRVLASWTAVPEPLGQLTPWEDVLAKLGGDDAAASWRAMLLVARHWETFRQEVRRNCCGWVATRHSMPIRSMASTH